MAARFTLDRYVADVLLRDLVAHDRSPAAFLVYFFLAAHGSGRRPRQLSLSLAEIADRTGLSKRAVQDAIGHLEARGLLQIDRRARTEAAVLTPLTPWRR
jgi:DNA-binding MarR family transcriptional regulator